MAAPDVPTAILALNDELALRILQAAQSLGLYIPEDLAVVGFDDYPNASIAGLTTLRQPLVQMGAAATQSLLSILRGETVPATTTSFLPELIVRGSTVPGHPVSYMY